MMMIMTSHSMVIIFINIITRVNKLVNTEAPIGRRGFSSASLPLLYFIVHLLLTFSYIVYVVRCDSLCNIFNEKGNISYADTQTPIAAAVDAEATDDRLVDSYTALHWAVENGDLNTVRLLLDGGADPNRGASFDAHCGVTPLHLAAQDGFSEIAEELLRRGARRDPRKRTRNRDNVTPLHQAAYNGHPATVAVLVRAGCDVNIQADNGYAAIHYAAQRGSMEMTRSILAAGRNDVAGSSSSSSRQRTADLGLLAMVKDQLDITALHLAVQSGSVDVIKALVEAGAAVDAGKRTAGGIGGVTALHQAVYQLREDVVETLLRLGADVNRSMSGWYRPLHVAAEKASASIAGRLIRAGAVVDARASVGDHGDLTALHVAAQHGHSAVVRVLVQAGADLTAVRRFADRSQITALHLAAENGFVDTVQVILELVKTKTAAGVSTASSGTSATSRTAGDRPVLPSSLQSYVNSQDSYGFTALHLAVQYQFLDIVQVLLAAGADITIKTVTGVTAVKLANHLPNVAIRDRLHVEANPLSSSTLRAASLPIPSKPDRRNRKTGGLRSLLCGANRK